MPANPEVSLPSTRFDINVARGALDQFEQWRWGVSPMFDLEVPKSERLSDFYLTAEGRYFGDVAISRARSTASLLKRGPRVIARAGLDSITVMVYTGGTFRLTLPRAEATVETGDILIYDFTRPLEIAATDYANMSLTIPRRLLEPLVGRFDLLHGLVLRRGAPMHGLLLGYMTELFGQEATFTASVASQISEATVRIVAAAADSASGTTTAVSTVGLIARVRAEIEANLSNPALDPAWLSARFNLSRATLYRAFRDYGGIRHHIQERRLHHAYRALAKNSPARIATIAERCGFPDQASFSRAFRSVYGLSPRDVTQIAQSRDLPPPNTTMGFLKLNRWIAGLEPAA